MRKYQLRNSEPKYNIKTGKYEFLTELVVQNDGLIDAIHAMQTICEPDTKGFIPANHIRFLFDKLWDKVQMEERNQRPESKLISGGV